MPSRCLYQSLLEICLALHIADLIGVGMGFFYLVVAKSIRRHSDLIAGYRRLSDSEKQRLVANRFNTKLYRATMLFAAFSFVSALVLFPFHADTLKSVIICSLPVLLSAVGVGLFIKCR